ncbi:50S ribosomal protein L23 [Candidatus Woesebacteria bacterium RIFCSPLOWO2_01_FULL_37_19]|uniref:50S ribosomal protein L23 n=2 Tax=Candidatus Woeseibacteriota TaxID=1752722 RepID=A0A1F8B280_9BACT|nr:MAG: 50S ribosomal protein L23 [Candidatus Woesebacteria bacterium RIFCSPHIGHO2_01_FULL_38_26b]OGM58102.1 MAG: 50S ribosomal protein L23 [Candidatus Woesebacteria bacterium RIFCSPLOWO2_01_FULL_37_19]
MRLEPLITEKSLSASRNGKYTFRVDKGLNKYQIAILIEKTFGVHVTSVRTLKQAGELKKTLSGRKRIIQPGKKAIVTLKEKEKIDLFEESKK